MNDQELEEQGNEPNLVRETRQDINKNPERGYTSFVLPQSAPGNKRKVGPNPVEANLAKHLKQASDALTTLTTKSQTKTLQDAPALYGQLLAAKLRSLSQRTQLILQNKIDNLVFEAELNEIDSSGATGGRSVTTNVISPEPNPSASSSHSSSSPN